MAQLSARDGVLHLELSRWERVFALHGDIRVPLERVAAVTVSSDPFGELRGLRAPGTGVPRRIALGTWRRRGATDFAALYGGRPGVIVQLRDSAFARLLVSADDAEGVAARITAP
jgi:hypothetical protein